ncbi:hypothetical protein HHK36_020486 [Tetracentron sinense]|uniref:Uncharacterized protein n=1 Tax=Tetracentron sinense TaxID=13715 RepID=A0A834YU48_TETSI|nr:hypothetical protein HHK36_020486 [Tetracentron sinense]
MGRHPCCEKMGLNKGPWASEEDRILMAHIQQHGHPNWRALPKQAGLLRCGKSCRLRWLNYLRPGIKRGDFSKEEEETVINLHEKLGNSWSAIATKLPGRTDNEIKNVWHTHLKKRLKENKANPEFDATKESEAINDPTSKSPVYAPVSSQESSSDFSAFTDLSAVTKANHIDSSETFPENEESFWEQAFPAEYFAMPSDSPLITDPELQLPFSPISGMEPVYGFRTTMDDGMGFWYNLFIKAGDNQYSEDNFGRMISFPGDGF